MKVKKQVKDFDGEVEDIPEIRFTDDPMERAMGIIGEENIGGESGPRNRVLRDIDDLEPGSRVRIAGHEAVVKKACFPQSMRLKNFAADKFAELNRRETNEDR